MSNGEEWQFHIATDCLMVKNGNFILLLTSTGQEWQFHIATDVIKNLIDGQEWQFHIATDI